MINIRNILPMLYDYYLVATEMSFSAAAEKNFLSQSNLSRSVQNLENTLNLQLINRTNKGITLTKDGEELYNKVDRIFNNLKNYDFDSSINDKVFTINQPVPYFNSDGTYVGMLNKGDKVYITYNNHNNTGQSRPWCYRVSKIVYANGSINNNVTYVSVGLEYGNGSNRAWY